MRQLVVGQTVKVMIQNINGVPIVEGDAIIKKIIEEKPDGYVFCQVIFNDDDQEVFRWIDLAIQK